MYFVLRDIICILLQTNFEALRGFFKDYFTVLILVICRSRWPRGLRRRPATARKVGLLVRIPPAPWIFVSCEFCLSYR